MHIILGSKFADGGDDSVKPPHCVTLDSCNLVLESELQGRLKHLKTLIKVASEKHKPRANHAFPVFRADWDFRR